MLCGRESCSAGRIGLVVVGEELVRRASWTRPCLQIVGSDKKDWLSRDAKPDSSVDDLLYISCLVIVNLQATRLTRDRSEWSCDETSPARKK